MVRPRVSPAAALTVRAVILMLCATLLPWLLPAPSHAAYVDERPSSSWGVNGEVRATAVAGDVVVVGGSFSSAVSPTGATVARQNLAAFDLRTGALLDWWRADASSTVRALATDGTSLWVGGSFTTIDGVSRNRLARLSVATGDVETGFRLNVSHTVYALHVEGSALWAGGDFTWAGGTSRTRLVKASAWSGAVDSSFRGSANNRVYALAKAAGTSRLYAGGSFSSLSGTSRNGVGGLDAATGSVVGPAFASAVRPTLGLDVDSTGSRLYGALGEYSNSLTAWSTSSGSRYFRQTAMGDVQAVEVYGDTVFFGFHEGFGGDTSLRLLAVDATTGALDGSFRPTFDRFWGIWSITATPGGLVAGGNFTRASGVTARYWARWLP